MADSDFLGGGWKFPVDVENGQIVLSEGEENIEQSIRMILGTKPGERLMRPEFGCDLNRLVFSENNLATATLVAYHVEQALLEWEPRIDVLNVSAETTGEGNQLNIQIDYMVKSSNTQRNLVYPFYMENN